MKKVFFLFCFIVLGYSFMHAGTWVVGVNQVADLLDKIEQGTGGVPPTVPMKEDQGKIVIDTDFEGVWDIMEGFTYTPGDILTGYLNHADAANHWRGIVSIDFAGKGYKQTAGTAILLKQPSLQSFDYSAIPDGFSKLADYWDRNDLSWLETIDFSGNDFSDVTIDGGPYREMPLKTVNLSNNPNLESLSIVNCIHLELVDIRGTALSAQAIEWIIEDAHEYSPNAVILSGSTDLKMADAPVLVVYMKGNNICVENKMPESNVSVYDPFGRLLLESCEDELDASSFGSGIYVVKVNDQAIKILKR